MSEVLITGFALDDAQFAGVGGASNAAFLRFYSNDQWVDADGDSHSPERVDGPNFFKSVALTVNTATKRIDETSFTITSTQDAIVNQRATYTVALYDSNGRRKAILADALTVPASPTTTTWAALALLNGAQLPWRDNTTLTRTEIVNYVAQQIGAVITPDASGVTKGMSLLSTAPASAALPIAVGANDYGLLGRVNAKSPAYGVVGNGVADDTAAIAAASATAHAMGLPLYVPAGTYKVSGSGAGIFTITKPIRVYGDGPKTIFLIANGVPTSRHLFLVTPPTSGISGFACASVSDCDVYNSAADNRGYEFDHFTVRGETPGAVGGSAIYFDLTVVNRYAYNTHIHHCFFENLGGRSIVFDNDLGAGPVNTDGAFTSTIDHCWIYDGILCEYASDSMTITQNVFRGLNMAFEGAFINNAAANFRFTYNNVTAGGGVRINNGLASLIEGNYFEAFFTGSTGSNGALLDLADLAGVTQHTVIRGNVFGSVLGLSLDGIRIAGDALQTIVEDNFYNLPAGKALVNFTDAAPATVANTVLGYNTQFGVGGETRGAATTPIYKPLIAAGPGLVYAGYFDVSHINANVELSGKFLRVNNGAAAPAYPTTGAGLEVVYDTDARVGTGALLGTGGSGAAIIQSYNRDAAALRDLYLGGSEILLEAAAGIRLGVNSSAVKGVLSNSASLNFPSVAADGGTQDLTISVPGVATGGAWSVECAPDGLPEAGLVALASVTAADTVTIRLTNMTAAPIDPAARTWRVTATKF